PRLRARFPDAPPIRSIRVRTTGVGESRLAEQVADLITAIEPLDVAFLPTLAGVDIRITERGMPPAEGDAALARAESVFSERIGRVDAAFLPTLAGVDIRITARGMPPAEAVAALARAESLFSERIGRAHFGRAGDLHPAVLGRALQARGWRVALAESCTGGLAAKLLTDIPGSSAYVLGGVVAYDNAVKPGLLGVDAALIEREGAVSEPVVRAMASGIRRITGAECGVAISGVAGPGGGTPEKPVGTVFIAAETPTRSEARRLSVPGERDDVRERSAVAALELLRRMLLNEEGA